MAASKKNSSPGTSAKRPTRSALETVSEAQPAHKVGIVFTCWSCQADCNLDLDEIQKVRLEYKLMLVKPNNEKPRKYFVKCSSCARFNSVIL